MSCYAVVAVTPNNEDWIPGYREAVEPMVARYGGKYLARTASHQRLEGDGESPALMVILEFPSRDAAEAFYNDPEYQPHLKARLDGAENHFVLVDGKDDFA